MSSTPLGDASIRITLDPEAARREASKLRDELRRIDEQRRKLHEEMERTLHAVPGGVASNRPNPASPGIPFPAPGSKPQANAWGPGGPTGMRGTQTPAGLDKLTSPQDLIDSIPFAKLIQKALQVGAQTAKQLPLLTESLKAATKGTPFEFLAQEADALTKGLAERVLKLEALVEAIPDTKTDVLDYNIAALKLGRLPTDQPQLIQDFYEINYQQLALRKTMDSEVQRDMVRKLPEAFKNALNR